MAPGGAKLGSCIQDPSHILIGLGPKGGCLPAGIPTWPRGAQEVHSPGHRLVQRFILVLIRISSIGEGVFILRLLGLILGLLVATAIPGQPVWPKVRVVLVEFRALLAVRLLIGLPFLIRARSWRAPRPRAAGFLDVVRYGDPQACSPPKSTSWREEQSRGGKEERGGEVWVGSALPDGTLAA